MGIGIPSAAFEELVAEGYLARGLPAHRGEQRLWVVNGPGAGHVRWRHPFPALFTSWGVVWRELRYRVPEGAYRLSASVARVEPDADGVTVVTEDGSVERFDAVIGADGYRSLTRGLVDPGSQPVYAGYVVWRGDVDLADLSEPVEPGMTTACFSGGHGNFYRMVGVDGRTKVNWVIYGSIGEHYQFSDPQSLPPGSVPDDLLKALDGMAGEHLSPHLADVVRATAGEHVSIQPLYDCLSGCYASGRVLLTGDAGTVARPHTGGGAMKAMQDCLALQRICREHDDWAQVMTAYDAQRRPACNALVEWGQRLGRPLVTHSPAWESMAEADFQALYAAAQAGGSTPYDPVPARR